MATVVSTPDASSTTAEGAGSAGWSKTGATYHESVDTVDADYVSCQPDTTTAGTGAGRSDYLDLLFPTAGLAGTETIDGVSFDIAHLRVIASPGSPDSYVINDYVVQQIYPSSPSGDNKASGTNWSTSPETITYGGAADVWGLSPTAAGYNTTTTGLRFQLSTTNAPGEDPYSSGRIDYVERTIYYTDPVTGGTGTIRQVIKFIPDIGRRVL